MTIPMEAVADLLPGAEKGEMPERQGQSDGDEATPAPQDPTGQDLGWWLTHPDAAQVKKAVLDLWKSTDKYEDKRSAKERRAELVRSGVRGVQVVEDEDEDRVSIRVPFGATDAPKAPNKADQLLRRIVATLTVDPPSPDVSPNADSDQERDAAQLAQRVLQVEGSLAKRDDVSMLRRALDLSGTYSTVYVHTAWDTRAAGLVPLAVQAHPKATTADNALVDPTPDATTGQPMPADPSQLVTRYVKGRPRSEWMLKKGQRKNVEPGTANVFIGPVGKKGAHGHLIEFGHAMEREARFHRVDRQSWVYRFTGKNKSRGYIAGSG
jgi:hypothetical protein